MSQHLEAIAYRLGTLLRRLDWTRQCYFCDIRKERRAYSHTSPAGSNTAHADTDAIEPPSVEAPHRDVRAAVARIVHENADALRRLAQ